MKNIYIKYDIIIYIIYQNHIVAIKTVSFGFSVLYIGFYYPYPLPFIIKFPANFTIDHVDLLLTVSFIF
jgi:hypothetical protein